MAISVVCDGFLFNVGEAAALLVVMSGFVDDVEKLIEEVEKRPELYKKSLREYSDANLKKKQWENVCQAVVAGFGELSDPEKAKQVQEVQKKWCNLRTCFRRELSAQKSTKSGQAPSKRRKYIYFEKLLFLAPCLEPRTTESNLETIEVESDDGNDATMESTASPTPSRKKSKNGSISDVDAALINALKQSEVDDDTNFALSIVPSLRELYPDEKLDAKINILTIFKEIRSKRVHEPIHSAPPQLPHSSSYSTTTLRYTGPSINRTKHTVQRAKPVHFVPSPLSSPPISYSGRAQNNYLRSRATPSPGLFTWSQDSTDAEQNFHQEAINDVEQNTSDTVQTYFSNFTDSQENDFYEE